MVDVDREQDIEIVRQVAKLALKENMRLLEKNKALLEQFAALKGEEQPVLQEELLHLKDLLRLRERALFDPKSERRPKADRGSQPESKEPRSGHGPRQQPLLQVVEEIHEDLPPDDQKCSLCGGELVPMGEQFEESEEITRVERRFVVVKHKRRKFRCACNGCVKTAEGPLKLQEGGRYSLEFAVGVATDKYCDHLPLDRQVRILRREGLRIESQTLWDQLNVLAKILLPIYLAIGLAILKSPILFADETRWRLLRRRDADPKSWYAWGIASWDLAFYKIQNSRSAEAAAELLGGYDGIVMADGYGAYETLARDGPQATLDGSKPITHYRLVNCWAHVRRKFVEAETNFPEPCGWILDRIGKLYEIERLVPFPGDAEGLALRARLRRERSKEIVAEIREWAKRTPRLPQSGLGQAIAYMTERWAGLTAFLEDPRVPLDNNHAERELRGLVVGRKNHYGSRSKRGTEVAALFYTLIESAKLAGVEPKAYLLAAAKAALKDPGKVLLPSDYAATLL